MRYSKKFIGKKIHHNKLGSGILHDILDDRLIIHFFNDFQQQRTFQYPACFTSKILSFDDPELQKLMKDNLPEKKVPQKKRSRKVNPFSARTSGSFYEKKLLPSFNQESWDEFKGIQSKRLAENQSEFSSLQEIASVYDEALESEIEAARKKPGKKSVLFQGILMKKSGENYTYRFRSSARLDLVPGSSIHISAGYIMTYGVIVAIDRDSVFFSCRKNLSSFLSQITIQSSPWAILVTLQTWLKEDFPHLQDTLCAQVALDGPKQIEESLHLKSRTEIVQDSITNPVSFIWGPPGTGKTEILADIALELLKQKKRVLLLSCSNIAVDQAFLRIWNKASAMKPGRLLRYGHARMGEVESHSNMTTLNYTLSRFPAAYDLKLDLEDERRVLSRKKDEESAQRHLEINKELSAIQQLLVDQEQEAFQKADLIAATAAKAVIDPMFEKDSFDAVIFDEASMAYVPYILYAANLAGKHFVCLGDFNQLPPVVQSTEKNSFLNLDIFQFCQITKAVLSGKGHRWLSVLKEQYRMQSSISDFVSKMMYHSLLQTNKNNQFRLAPITKSMPFEEWSLGIVDIRSMNSLCISRDSSKANIFSAFATVMMLLQSPNPKKAGIITPFALQADLIQSILKDLFDDETKIPVSSTVHQFQGSERDMIFYDVCNGYNKNVSPLLKNEINDSADRLFNVALTRAKGKFVMIADVDYLTSKITASRMIRKFIEYANWKGRIVQGETAAEELTRVTHPAFSFYDFSDGEKKLLEDLKNAKEKIMMHINGRMEYSLNFVNELTDLFEKALENGIDLQLTCQSEIDLPETLVRFFSLRSEIINTFTIIDHDILWMNTPSSLQKTPMGKNFVPSRFVQAFRYKGSSGTSAVESLLNEDALITGYVESFDGPVPYKSFKRFIEDTTDCPKCQSALTLKTSSGRSFLGCTGFPVCSYIRNITEEDIQAYLDVMNSCYNSLGFDYANLTIQNRDFELVVHDTKSGKDYTLPQI